MGFDAFKQDEGEQTDDQDSDPSGTHLYLGQHGYERLPADVRNSDSASDDVAEAYELVKSSAAGGGPGPVRQFADMTHTGGIHHLIADVILQVEELRQQQSPRPIVDWVLDDFDAEARADVLFSYMEDNPEVGQLVAEKIRGSDEGDE